jgi:hypothetical protein
MGVRGHGLVSKVLCLAAEIGRTRLNVPSVAKGGLLFGRIDSSQSSDPRWYDSTTSTFPVAEKWLESGFLVKREGGEVICH